MNASVTFEDIKRANESIKTTDIKGKEYAEVNQRIKAFRMVYPMGCIQTNIESIENGVCIISAIVGYYGDDGCLCILGQGTAYEKEGSTFINKTSYIENCETSAVGRALGMAGFGIDVSVASYEEVANAIKQQNEKPVKKVNAISEEQKNEVVAMLLEMKAIPAALCARYGLDSISEMSTDQFRDFRYSFEEWKEKQKNA